MRVERAFDVTINVANPIDFVADINRHVMSELTAIYSGRALRGVFILEILRIRSKSALIIKTADASGSAYMHVQFVALVHVLAVGDILTGVEIVTTQPMVIGRWSEPGVRDKAAKVTAAMVGPESVSLAERQIVPIQIKQTLYDNMHTDVSVGACMLVCDRHVTAYRLKGALTREHAGELEELARQVTEELEARAGVKGVRQEAVWFYERLLYAYRAQGDSGDYDQAFPYDKTGPGSDLTYAGPVSWHGPAGVGIEKGASIVNLLDMVRRAAAGESVPVAGVWCRSRSICRSAPVVAYSPGPLEAWQTVEGDTLATFLAFLTSTRNYLVAIRELASQHSPDLRKSNQSVWKLMRAAQERV